MAYYLQFNGTTDRLSLPSMTFTEIVMDVKIQSKAQFERYFSLPFGAEYLQVATGGVNDQFSAGVTQYVNDVAQTNLTTMLPVGTRVISRSVMTVKTNVIYIFNNNGSNIAHGDIWDIKIYNGATLQAHYDLSTQTVNDQSGNGRHATLTGGTYLDDGVGGGTTEEGSATLQGVLTLTADGQATANGFAELTVVATLTATGTMSITGSVNLQAVATLTASGTAQTPIEEPTIISTVTLQAQRILYITLSASQDLNITLQAERELNVTLQGALMTRTKQDFKMYAGETKIIKFPMIDKTDLTGASIQWTLRRNNVTGDIVVSKSTPTITISGTVFTVKLNAADTSALIGKFYHEAIVTDTSGNVSKVETGCITIER